MGPRLCWMYICAVVFLDMLATSLLVPFLPLHLRTYGLPRLTVGLITSVYPSVQLFSSSAVGFYSDKYGQKSTLVVSLLSCSLAYYSLASTTSILNIFVCRVILGAVKHTQTICKAAFITHNRLSETVGFGGLSAAEALGFMLGPVIGAHFIDGDDGFCYLCKITTALFVVNAVTAFLVLPAENRVINRSTKQNENILDICKKKNLVNLNCFWDLLMLKLILCFSLSLFYINYHVLVVELLDMSPSMVGYTNSFQGLICIITSLFARKISDVYIFRCYYLKLSFCFLLLSGSFFSFAFVFNSSYFVMFLIPLSCGSCLLRIYLSEALTTLSSASDKASVFGLENTIATVANLTSPFFLEIFNYVIGSSSIMYLPFLISGIGSVFSFILFLAKEKISFC